MTATTKFLRTSVEQTLNNTTSWIGHHPYNHHEHGRGQTFIAVNESDVNSIAVYTNVVTRPGKVALTIHDYDANLKTWGPALGSASVNIHTTDSGKWIAFNLPSLHLKKGQTYGFRLDSHDSFIGVGEAAGSANQPPLNEGQEWLFTDHDRNGNAFSYFSLAFKVGTRD